MYLCHISWYYKKSNCLAFFCSIYSRQAASLLHITPHHLQEETELVLTRLRGVTSWPYPDSHRMIPTSLLTNPTTQPPKIHRMLSDAPPKYYYSPSIYHLCISVSLAHFLSLLPSSPLMPSRPYQVLLIRLQLQHTQELLRLHKQDLDWRWEKQAGYLQPDFSR